MDDETGSAASASRIRSPEEAPDGSRAVPVAVVVTMATLTTALTKRTSMATAPNATTPARCLFFHGCAT
ncbi:hypothetical protein ACIBO2_46405 [Nonomuraea sp. NPDC050022]|uniref:hypothetical protein n=1 Tax=unclassified Nonomuraea TaxID=2593643 RepID=UPI0033DD75AD